MESTQKITITPAGDALTIRTGSAERVYEYKGFRYHPETARSFVDLIRAKGDVGSTVVFINDKEARAILDDAVTDREQDIVTYAYQMSVSAKEWGSVLNDPNGDIFGIKRLSDFLKRRPEGEVVELDKLLHAVQNFKYVTNIEGDFTFDNRNNYVFSIKMKEGEGTVRVPQLLTARLELLEGSGFAQDVEVEVEVHRPKDQSSEPRFLLSCPKYPRYWREAVLHERDRIAADLEGYLIVSGTGSAR